MIDRAFSRTALRALALCVLAGFSGASATSPTSITPGVDVRRVSDEVLADAFAASRPKTQVVMCGSSSQSTLGPITRRRGRFRCVA